MRASNTLIHWFKTSAKKNRSSELINSLNTFGACPTYKLLNAINNKIASSKAQVLAKENAVVPSVNRLNIFSTAGFGNAKYNPSLQLL